MKTKMRMALPGLFSAVLLVAVIMVVCAPAAAGEQRIDLWQRAVDHLSDNCFLPGKVAIDEEILDSRGKLYEHRRYSFRVEQAGARRVKPRLLTALANGINAMYAMRKEIEKPVSVQTWLEASPLFASSRAAVTAKPLGQERTVAGLRCIGFGFKGRGPMGEIEGTAWLAVEDGLPVQVESVVVSVPFEADADGIQITSYSQTDSYGRTPNGVCVLHKRRVFSGIREDYMIMTFKGTADITYTFSDHWRYQSGNDTVTDNNHMEKRLP